MTADRRPRARCCECRALIIVDPTIVLEWIEAGEADRSGIVCMRCTHTPEEMRVAIAVMMEDARDPESQALTRHAYAEWALMQQDPHFDNPPDPFRSAIKGIEREHVEGGNPPLRWYD